MRAETLCAVSDDDVVPATGWLRLSPALVRAITEPRERDLSVRACTVLANADLRSMTAVRAFLSEQPDGLLTVRNCGPRLADFIKTRIAAPPSEETPDLIGHPRCEGDQRDEIELFLRDAYAAGANAAHERIPYTAMEYAAREAPKLRAALAAASASSPAPTAGARFVFSQVEDWQRANKEANACGLMGRVGLLTHDPFSVEGGWVARPAVRRGGTP